MWMSAIIYATSTVVSRITDELKSNEIHKKYLGDVYQPKRLPPKVKVHGFNITRREVSGERFWNFVKTKWKTAQNFFQDCFVTNYCPIAFLSETGKNITPAELRFVSIKILRNKTSIFIFVA